MSKTKLLFPFVVLLGLAFGLENTNNAISIISALLVHEAGHIIMLKAVGGKIRYSSLFGIGADIEYQNKTLSNRSEGLIYLAGPLFGLCGSLIGYTIGLYIFAKYSLVFSLINLIPAMPLDGGNILRASLPMNISDRVIQITSIYIGFFISVYGLYNIYLTGNFSSFIFGISVLISNIIKRTLQ